MQFLMTFLKQSQLSWIFPEKRLVICISRWWNFKCLFIFTPIPGKNNPISLEIVQMDWVETTHLDS